LRVLLIGYGSIGQRHKRILESLDAKVDVVTKQKLRDKTTFKSLKSVKNLKKYDYFIIASETTKHFQQLKYLDSKVKNKKIFCEKPLFETDKKLDIKNNKVYVGYVLRFHPLLQKLKKLLQFETVISSNIICGQYLPTWREGRDYRESYSASKKDGGGVLLDLSHEIDYAQWLFGEVKELKSYQVKISDLEIDSDDLTMFIGKTKNNIMLNISVDYISKLTHREMFVETLQHTYKLDFIKNRLVKIGKDGSKKIYKIRLQRDTMFIKQHKSILKDKNIATTFQQAKNVMKTIKIIQDSK